MTKHTIIIILLLTSVTACSRKKNIKNISNKTSTSYMDKENFQKIINKIKTSDTFENPQNWKVRGLIPSDQIVINILRNATNNFLDKLEKIYNSNETSDTKLEQISDLVDELPWDELDTEEKEFMAYTLAPAIEAAGFDPWTIY
jgi:hypothetical protein